MKITKTDSYLSLQVSKILVWIKNQYFMISDDLIKYYCVGCKLRYNLVENYENTLAWKQAHGGMVVTYYLMHNVVPAVPKRFLIATHYCFSYHISRHTSNTHCLTQKLVHNILVLVDLNWFSETKNELLQ